MEHEIIMAMKPLVRIIKRGQKIVEAERAVGGAAAAVAATAAGRVTAESSARDIKTTVSNWVREFQQRSRTDSKRAFNNLFKEPLPSPSES